MSKDTEKKVNHSKLYEYIAEESARFVLKSTLCVDILLMCAMSLTPTVRQWLGMARSAKQGGKKGTDGFTYAKAISDGLTNAMARHFIETTKECEQDNILAALEYDDNGRANLQVVEVKDAGGNNYTMQQGSLLRRLRAAFMTLCGDWQPLHDNREHEAVREFIAQYGEKRGDQVIGFSVNYAVTCLQRKDAAMFLETIASAKAEINAELNKDAPKAEPSKDDNAEGEESAVTHSPQIEALLKTVGKLKEAILHVADNATVDECEAWQDAIAKMIETIDVKGGEAPKVENPADAPKQAKK